MVFLIEVLLIVFIITVIINVYVYNYRKKVIFRNIKDFSKCKYAIVPGARINIDKPCDKLEDRLIAAINLYNKGIVDKIIVSGGYEKDIKIHEADFMKNYLIKKGINAADIIKDYYGINTYSTMYRVKKYVKNDSVIICTQKMYSGRSVYLAHKLKLNAYCIISDTRKYKKIIGPEIREYISRNKAFINCNIYKKKNERLKNIDFKI